MMGNKRKDLQNEITIDPVRADMTIREKEFGQNHKGIQDLRI
jgi:hypothetical protein